MNHSKPKLLIVDDEADQQELMSQAFLSKPKFRHYEFLYAANGKLALDQIQETDDIEIILLDINMPVMGGLEATQKLREIGCSQPIYALTAEHGSEEIRASIDAGCNGHLTKPIEIKSFYQTLAQYLPANPAAG